MLRALTIRDIVLIDRLDLNLAAGLCVLTGETGAGKSILLDALGLALGARADSGLVRHGAAQGSVTAAFQLAAGHPAAALAAEHAVAVEEGDDLVLRRVVAADGRSRAFVNDQPVSVGLLRRLGATLVEMHGQNDEQGLLDAATHRDLLDAFGGCAGLREAVQAAFAARRRADQALAAAVAAAAAGQREEGFLRHVVDELAAIDPEPDEEERLAVERTHLMQSEKIAEALRDAAAALEDGDGIAGRLRAAERAVERVAARSAGRLDGLLQALDRAQAEVAEVAAALTAAGRDLDADPGRLERIEERLFSLRALARKHGCAVDALPALRQDLEMRLAGIEAGAAGLADLERACAAARDDYCRAAEALSAARAKAARQLDRAVGRELPPLRLTAVFQTVLERLTEAEWSPDGWDRVRFEVSTNPGTPPGPLARIASGGELSRFMLALRVVLARQGSATTLVFDEVDRGIGGATADAVGERLARLAEGHQVLVVTHSPQVAARGTHHWRIAKGDKAGGRAAPRVSVGMLDSAGRREEIARMLAGATVTEQARAAAGSLLAGERP